MPERMALHVPGQFARPEPRLGKTCVECLHFASGEFKDAPEKGRCRLLSAHQAGFNLGFAGTAIACPSFEASA